MEPEIKIRGYHTDIYQHVNNARYLEFLEEGRWQLFDDFLNVKDFTSGKYSMYVVNININYLGQAKTGDTIIVKSGLLKIGGKSAVLKQQILKKDSASPIIDADITFVIVDNNTQKAVKLQGELGDMISKFPAFKA